MSHKAAIYGLLLIWIPLIGSLGLKPPEEEILSSHLCPSLVAGKKDSFPGLYASPQNIMTVRLQQFTKSRDNRKNYSRFHPCTFVEEKDPVSISSADGFNASVVRVKAINLNTVPWNFTGSDSCSKLIVFRSWGDYGNGHSVACRNDNFDQYLGPYGHPMILFYHLRYQGMSFPLFHPNYGPGYREKSFLELKHMLIYYSITKADGERVCRLQQYILDPMQNGCSPNIYSSHTICGEYNCSQIESVYQRTMGVFQAGKLHQQFIIINSKTQERYRVRNFLRQKFVPILFLLVLIFAYKSYMKAGLRYNDPISVSEARLGRRHHFHHHSSQLESQDGSQGSNGHHHRHLFTDYDNSPQIIGPSVLSHDYRSIIVNAASSSIHSENNPHNEGRAHRLVEHRDPPPSYDSLFPPAYTDVRTEPAKNSFIA